MANLYYTNGGSDEVWGNTLNWNTAADGSGTNPTEVPWSGTDGSTSALNLVNAATGFVFLYGTIGTGVTGSCAIGFVGNNGGTIDGGIFTGVVSNGSEYGDGGTINGGTFSNTISNYGTINGGTFNGVNFGYNINATFINGGTFNGGVSGYETFNYITAGTFNGGVTLGGYSSGISGGTFNSYVAISNDVVITAGTFNGNVDTSQYSSIGGGTFTSNVNVGVYGNIGGGTFTSSVSNDNYNSGISGGTFSGSVSNNGNPSSISGGTFSGSVSTGSEGSISGGTFEITLFTNSGSVTYPNINVTSSGTPFTGIWSGQVWSAGAWVSEVPPPLTDNTLAYWNLNNNGSGGVSLVDSTGNGYSLTNENGVTLGTGIIGGDAVFGVAGQRLTSSLTIDTTSSSFSISFWVNASSLVGENYILYPQNAYETGFFFLNDSFCCTQTFSSNQNLFTYNNIDSWNHICVVVTGSNYTSYLNGSLQGSIEYVPYISTNSELGGSSLTGGSLQGSIDEVGIWNRALSQSDVTKLYNEGIGLTYPFPDALYFNAAVNGSLSTLGNWWQDDGFTIPADALPDSATPVVISSAVTSGTATYASATITANIGSAVTINAPTNLTNATNAGALVGNSTLNGTSSNTGTITGAVTLNGTSSNVGTITGAVTLNGTSSNVGTITGSVTLNDTSFNSGGITGNVTFNENSYQGTGGVITGNASVYHPAQNPLGGSVTGTITYFWPGGTGLWGGEVWIDGSLSFIIPDPSDVRSGVEYGPADSPYIGTFSGGSGIDLARLIGLPPFIQI
jgi:hypothetical protein